MIKNDAQNKYDQNRPFCNWAKLSSLYCMVLFYYNHIKEQKYLMLKNKCNKMITTLFQSK